MLVEPMAFSRSHWHWVLGDRTQDGYRHRACHGSEFELTPLKGRSLADLEGLFPCEECETWGLERDLPGHDDLMATARAAAEQVAASARSLDYPVPGIAPEPGQLSCGRCGQELGMLSAAEVLAVSMGQGHRCPDGPPGAEYLAVTG